MQPNENILIPSDQFEHFDNEKFAIILNQSEFTVKKSRPGTHVDEFNLKDNLKKLKCNYVVFENLNRDDIMYSVPKYVKSKLKQFNHDMDGLIFFILTHGSFDDMLCASNESYNLYDFINKFSAIAFPSMANKPKLFFISACRGNKVQDTSTVNMRTGESVVDGATKSCVVEPRQMYKNLLIAFGAYENHFGIREPINGTFFIQMLCDRFDSFVRDTTMREADIMDILVETNNKLIQRVGWIKDRESPKKMKAQQLGQVYCSLMSPYIFRK